MAINPSKTFCINNAPMTLTKHQSGIDKLDPNALSAIFHCLDDETLATCRLVCKNWRQIIVHNRSREADTVIQLLNGCFCWLKNKLPLCRGLAGPHAFRWALANLFPKNDEVYISQFRSLLNQCPELAANENSLSQFFNIWKLIIAFQNAKSVNEKKDQLLAMFQLGYYKEPLLLAKKHGLFSQRNINGWKEMLKSNNSLALQMRFTELNQSMLQKITRPYNKIYKKTPSGWVGKQSQDG